ncbi:MAG TPA: hypothetical protein VFB19_18670 [Mycobacterium sp.]|nr:hypothetical protein [Mycobacterium sp.]
MKRLLVLPAVGALCAAEAFRRGIVWPIWLYGVAPYLARRRVGPNSEQDVMG